MKHSIGPPIEFFYSENQRMRFCVSAGYLFGPKKATMPTRIVF